MVAVVYFASNSTTVKHEMKRYHSYNYFVDGEESDVDVTLLKRQRSCYTFQF